MVSAGPPFRAGQVHRAAQLPSDIVPSAAAAAAATVDPQCSAAAARACLQRLTARDHARRPRGDGGREKERGREREREGERGSSCALACECSHVLCSYRQAKRVCGNCGVQNFKYRVSCSRCQQRLPPATAVARVGPPVRIGARAASVTRSLMTCIWPSQNNLAPSAMLAAKPKRVRAPKRARTAQVTQEMRREAKRERNTTGK
jgi:hypothetical protein